MIVKCSVCGKEIERKASKASEKNYCSRACLGKANAERYAAQRKKECDYCGKTFDYCGHHTGRNNHFFCSKQCAYDFKVKRVEVECELCGRTFLKKKSDVNRSNHNFCCEECYKDYIALNRSTENMKFSGKPLYRLIVEQRIGCDLPSEKDVHHIDGDHNNNVLTNLMIVTRSEHSKIHAAKKQRNEKGQFAKGDDA